MTAALLLLLAAVHFLPEWLLPSLMGGTRSAWFYVASGAEAAALWAQAFVLLRNFPARCVAAWGLFEALQRPVCRLAFPMDRAPELPEGSNLCDAAFGLPMSLLSVVCALFLAALMQEVQRAAKRA